MERKSRILIVDDEEMLLDTLRSSLSSKGYHCEVASTSQSAFELINKASFDIMILDLVLPDGHGFELSKKAKSLNPDMKVILMTGYSEDVSYDDAIEAGASDFIKKPFSLKSVLDAGNVGGDGKEDGEGKRRDRCRRISLHQSAKDIPFVGLAENQQKDPRA